MTDDGFWDAIRPFDTDKESPLRDDNPDLWAAIHGAELVQCIPFGEFKNSESLQYWVYSYVRVVAMSVSNLFNPDGTLKVK